jgi:ATP-dependent Clp protease ATP-binding subunit ClpA
VFERFTSRARQVIVYAQDEAHTHERIGTEHLLLGLLREQEGLAARRRAKRRSRTFDKVEPVNVRGSACWSGATKAQ